MQFVWYCVICAAILVVPGLLVALVARVRGFMAFALAPALSTALIGFGAIALTLVHVPFTPVSVAVVALVAAILTFVATRLLARRFPTWWRPPGRAVSLRHNLELFAAFVLGIPLSVWNFSHIVLHSDDIYQRGDVMFHLNAVQWITQHHDGSSLTIHIMDAGHPDGFYPCAWHDWSALALMIRPHLDVTPATNAANLMAITVAWLPGLLVLMRALFGHSRLALGTAVLLAYTLPAFPNRLLSWGPGFPNILGLVLVPVVLALAVEVLRTGRGRPSTPLGPGVFGVVVGLAAIAVAHPSAFVSATLLLVPQVFIWWWRERRRPLPRRRRLALHAAVAATVLVEILVWWKIRPPMDSAHWEAWVPNQSILPIGIVVGMSGMEFHPDYPAMILVLLGIAVAIRRRYLRWLVGLHVAMGAIFLNAALTDNSPTRYFLSGAWYSDINRIDTMFTFTGLPLAALAVWEIGRRVRVLAHGWRPLRHPAVGLAAALAFLGVLGVACFHGATNTAYVDGRSYARKLYSTTEDGQLIDYDEREMFRELPGIVPADDTVIDSVWDGSALQYATTGRRGTEYAFLAPKNPDQEFFNAHLREAATNPEVCERVRALRAYWVLDFRRGQFTLGPGRDDLDTAPGFVNVLQKGEKILYRIDACGH